jgi:GTP-binding protein Era
VSGLKKRAGFVVLIGRPSSGKSTLLNKLCGYKVSIVSPVPQTTRNKVRGIVTRPAGQIVFIDTPGYHISDKKMNLHLMELVQSSLKDADAVLYLIDLTRPVGEEEKNLMRILFDKETFSGPVLTALNKADVTENYLQDILKEISACSQEKQQKVQPKVISALSGTGLEELLMNLIELMPESDYFYPDDIYTDQAPEFRIAEIIREKAINKTYQEVPHALFVEISDMEMQEKALWVRGFIFVERDSQKGILVGKGGLKIKAIVRESEQEIKTLFPYTVKLDIRVKVKPKWRKKESLLKRLIR